MLVGLSGVFVNLAALYLLKQEGMSENFAALLAIELSILTNFVGHSLLTFRVARNHGATIDSEGKRLLAFQITSALATVVIYTIAFSLRGVGVNSILAQFNGITVAAIINYVLSTRIIWGPYFRHAR